MKQILTRQDVRAIAGRMIICGFDGTSVTPELRELLREVQPLGLILFARNIESPEHVAEFARELKSLRKNEPLLLSVDQEGGRVARIRAPATEWPTMREVGRAGDPQLAYRVGQALARELRAMSFDIDYAPVLDVDTNPDNPVIGDRAFSDHPEQVGELGALLTRGLQEHGVAACGKHFPGHGDTDLDSHLALPYVDHDIDRLRDVEWRPFVAASKAGLSSVMTAHVMVEALDRQHPGTLSPTILSHLREEIGFNGVIVSDDIEMKAVAERYSPAEIASRGTLAGVDLFLACHLPEITQDLYRGLVQAVERKEITHARLLESNRRLLDWRDKYYAPAATPEDFKRWVGCGEHLHLAQTIRERAAGNAARA